MNLHNFTLNVNFGKYIYKSKFCSHENTIFPKQLCNYIYIITVDSSTILATHDKYKLFSFRYDVKVGDNFLCLREKSLSVEFEQITPQ